MNVTKEMITAGHKAVMESGEVILSAGMLRRIYVAMSSAKPQRPDANNVREALKSPGCERLREWVQIGPAQRASFEEAVYLINVLYIRS